jgi:hypothetical protein
LKTERKKMPNRANGPKARDAVHSREERAAWAKKGAEVRYKTPKANFSGTLQLGELAFDCHVLSDGTRIITKNTLLRALEIKKGGKISNEKSGSLLDLLIADKRLFPFVNKHLKVVQNLDIRYRTPNNQLALGIPATIIPAICNIWVDANAEFDLPAAQKRTANRALKILQGLAIVGITALVDEVTGYEKSRAARGLTTLLETFLAKELQPWSKTFSDKYYEQLHRLWNIPMNEEFPHHRPKFFGHLTNNLVYRRLAPGLLEELRTENKKIKERENKNPMMHQSLTRETGITKLKGHLLQVEILAQAAETKEDFMKTIDKVLPLLNQDSIEYIEEDFSNQPQKLISYSEK